jgi:hypothetical protein
MVQLMLGLLACRASVTDNRSQVSRLLQVQAASLHEPASSVQLADLPRSRADAGTQHQEEAGPSNQHQPALPVHGRKFLQGQVPMQAEAGFEKPAAPSAKLPSQLLPVAPYSGQRHEAAWKGTRGTASPPEPFQKVCRKKIAKPHAILDRAAVAFAKPGGGKASKGGSQRASNQASTLAAGTKVAAMPAAAVRAFDMSTFPL